MVKSLSQHSLYALGLVLFALSSLSGAETPANRSSSRTGEDTPTLTVNIYNHAGAAPRTLAAARREAARIFRAAGIETEWPGCPTEPEQIPQFPNCKLAGPASLAARIIPRSMARPRPSSPAAFGVALIPKDGSFGVFASVYIDAAGAIAGDDEAFGARMLGHLIAHEVGHLLLGKGSYSKKGIMLGDWLHTDLEKAAQGRLLFSDRQAKKMRRAVRQRSRIDSAD